MRHSVNTSNFSSGVLFETQTLARISPTGRDLEFLVHVDQDRGAGSWTNDAGRVSGPIRSFIRRCSPFRPTSFITAQSQRMDSAFIVRRYKCSDSILSNF